MLVTDVQMAGNVLKVVPGGLHANQHHLGSQASSSLVNGAA